MLKDEQISVYVGTADTFYLDGPIHLLDTALTKLGAQASIHRSGEDAY